LQGHSWPPRAIECFWADNASLDAAEKKGVKNFRSSTYCVFPNRTRFPQVCINLGGLGESGRAFSGPKTQKIAAFPLTSV
jgi:hypothetical protein